MPTYPGINPNFDYSALPVSYRPLVTHLSRSFYVTRHVERIEIGNSYYYGFLMRPSDNMSILLNVERELAVLVAPYDSFEARTLNAYDELYRTIDDARVDKSVRFLISDDTRIDEQIRHFLDRNPEYPIIIPFHTNEILSYKYDSNIVTKIRSHYTIRDLFAFSNALRQEYFYFGRDNLVNKIIDDSRAGQNSTIFGLRKSGKTSTIYAVQRRAQAAGIACATIDCEDPAVHGKSYNSLLQTMLREVQKAIGVKQTKESLGSMPDEVSSRFRTLMDSALSVTSKNVLVILDEIENISPGTASSKHWSEGQDTIYLWQTIRSYFQSQKKIRITFCFVGTNPTLFEEPNLNGVTNPVFLFAPNTYLSGISYEDTRNMCVRLGYFMGLDFDDQVVVDLYERFGGHAFFVRQACSEIHKGTDLNRPAAISKSSVESALRSAQPRLRKYFNDIIDRLRRFYPVEYDMLVYLAAGDLETFQEISSKYPSSIEHIAGYGLIRRKGMQYEFAFSEVEEMLKENIGSLRTDMKRIVGEISVRRTEIEKALRTELFYWSRNKDSDWVEKTIADCLSAKRRSEVGTDPRTLFSSIGSPLYLSEVALLYKVAFESREDVRLVVEDLFTINELRVDAHPKKIEGDMLERLFSALDRVEAAIMPPT